MQKKTSINLESMEKTRQKFFLQATLIIEKKSRETRSFLWNVDDGLNNSSVEFQTPLAREASEPGQIKHFFPFVSTLVFLFGTRNKSCVSKH